ncbi:MAG: hypothetical protein SX243_13910 [Acidobacteriota bacterium]|nr:hypothetical protein [Acidobacteriota bacterium]
MPLPSSSRPAPRPTLWFRLLPVALLAVMVGVGLGLEWAVYQGPRILTKLPLIVLLLVPLLRRWRFWRKARR